MPALTGFLWGGDEQWTRDHLNIVPLDDLGDQLFDERQASEIPEGSAGEAASGFVERTPDEWIGTHAHGFTDDYYDRVHVRPTLIDLGSTLSVQTREVEVWSAYFEPNALEEITADTAEGLSFTGPLPPPTLFGALESRLYSLSATPSGPPVMDATFRLFYSRGDHPRLRVIGRRLVGWIAGPDWTEPVVETLEWLTDVIESQGGWEQRVRLRASPRREIEYRLLLGSDRARVHAENRLIGWQGRVYALPEWVDAYHSPAAIAAGADTLAVPTAHRDFRVGGLVALVHGLRSEFGEITEIAPDWVRIASPLGADWPIGTRILPARNARIQNDLALGYVTDAVIQSRPRFRLEDAWAITPAVEAEDYRGYPLLLTPPDWSEDLEGQFARNWRELDYLTGRALVDDLSGVSRMLRTHRWLLVGRPAIAAFRAWLAARAGRLAPFWLPSFQHDFRLVAPVIANDPTLTVEHRGTAEVNLPALGRQDILITTQAGARLCRRIEAASVIDEESESLALDDDLGAANLQPADIRQISTLRLVRLEADRVEIAHLTDALAQVALTLRAVRDDLP